MTENIFISVAQRSAVCRQFVSAVEEALYDGCSDLHPEDVSKIDIILIAKMAALLLENANSKQNQIPPEKFLKMLELLNRKQTSDPSTISKMIRIKMRLVKQAAEAISAAKNRKTISAKEHGQIANCFCPTGSSAEVIKESEVPILPSRRLEKSEGTLLKRRHRRKRIASNP